MIEFFAVIIFGYLFLTVGAAILEWILDLPRAIKEKILPSNKNEYESNSDKLPNRYDVKAPAIIEQTPIAITATKDKKVSRAFPINYEADPEVANVLKAVSNYVKPVIVTGKAGTGKSTLVRFLQKEIDKAVVVAPTGIAAINIGGQTVHSFFRLPPRIFTPEELSGQRANRLWTKIDTVIVDEISMVRADILDGIDYVLRKARRNSKPFGGVRIILVGDFHQLPPVVPNREAEILSRMGYDTPFAYSAKVMKRTSFEVYELSTVHRQSDRLFLSILSQIRRGQNIESVLQNLNEICLGSHRTGKTPLLLTGTNSTASHYNEAGLNALTTRLVTFTGIIEGKFNIAKDKLPVPEKIDLKIGARVMAAKNDPEKKWINGSLGTVTQIFEDGANVKFDNGFEGLVRKSSWENIKYEWDDEQNKPISKVIGSYSQIPLKLAWAITIHKSQGLTLEDVRLDLKQSAFATGQTYVALSRATTMEGLSLARALTPADILVEHSHDLALGLTKINSSDIAKSQNSEVSIEVEEEQMIETNSPKLVRAYSDGESRIPIYSDTEFRTENVENLKTGFSHKVEISYADYQGNTTIRDIDAFGIVETDDHQNSYVFGFCGMRQAKRSFRFDRIRRLYDIERDKYITKDIESYLRNLGGK